tara:strand:+ start:415 stop:660 length:246 start_codon:yes stop_codon:yes gene_type:complete
MHSTLFEDKTTGSPSSFKLPVNTEFSSPASIEVTAVELEPDGLDPESESDEEEQEAANRTIAAKTDQDLTSFLYHRTELLC